MSSLLEDAEMGTVEIMTSFPNNQQQATKHCKYRRPPSPDLIQLSDSDSNFPSQARNACGYVMMVSDEVEAMEGRNDDNAQDGANQIPEEQVTVTEEVTRAVIELRTNQTVNEELETFIAQENSSPKQGASGSSDPELSSPASVSSAGSDSATPTNMLTHHHCEPGPWQHNTLPASHRHSSNWQRLVNDEHCQLLGTEEDSSERHSSNEEEEDEDEDHLLQNVQEVYMDPLPSPEDCENGAASKAVVSCSDSFEQQKDANGTASRTDAVQADARTVENLASSRSLTEQVKRSLPQPGDPDGIWRISEEQRDYYTQQFRRLQPNLSSTLPGQQAKLFFEKSKLPTDQLTRIWHLSDVTQDGALSLHEFLVAMHLVVARRNGVALPSVLPVPLLTLLLPSLQHSGAETQRMLPRKEDVSGQQLNQETYQHSTGGSSSSGASSVVSSLPPPTTVAPTLPLSDGGGSEGGMDASPSRSGKEWTKFADSPTSAMSSPGIKPANFDFQKNAVDKDPRILHPKPVRLTPEPQSCKEALVSNAGDSKSADSHPEHDLLHHQQHLDFHRQQHTGGSISSTSSSGSSNSSAVFSNICNVKSHRPLPRKPNKLGSSTASALSSECSQFGPASLPVGRNTLVSPTASHGLSKLLQPPPPPPRPTRTHTRSSSLDLNKYSLGCGVQALGAPPAVPPRSSPGTVSPIKRLVYQRSDGDVGDNSVNHGRHIRLAQQKHAAKQQLQQSLSVSETVQSLPRVSAFEVYRKHSSDGNSSLDQTGLLTESGSRELVPHDFDLSHSLDSTCVSISSASAKLKDKKEVTASIRTTRDRNTILGRLNAELNLELAEVIEERIALEMQLEQMKLFSN